MIFHKFHLLAHSVVLLTFLFFHSKSIPLNLHILLLILFFDVHINQFPFTWFSFLFLCVAPLSFLLYLSYLLSYNLSTYYCFIFSIKSSVFLTSYTLVFWWWEWILFKSFSWQMRILSNWASSLAIFIWYSTFLSGYFLR